MKTQRLLIGVFVLTIWPPRVPPGRAGGTGQALPHCRDHAQRAPPDIAFSQSMFSALKAVQAEMAVNRRWSSSIRKTCLKVPDAAPRFATMPPRALTRHRAWLAVRGFGARDRERLPQDHVCLGTDVNHVRPAPTSTPIRRRRKRAAM